MVKNSKLENLFKLSSKVTVIVPATINVNEEINNKPYVERVAALMSDCFGGATSSETIGYWKSPRYGLVAEKSTTVYSYCSESDLSENLEKVVDLCMDLKDELTQEAIAMEVNGEMYFI